MAAGTAGVGSGRAARRLDPTGHGRRAQLDQLDPLLSHRRLCPIHRCAAVSFLFHGPSISSHFHRRQSKPFCIRRLDEFTVEHTVEFGCIIHPRGPDQKWLM